MASARGQHRATPVLITVSCHARHILLSCSDD